MNATGSRISRSSQAGMSIMELMVAISIGFFLLLGITAVFVTSNRTYTDLARASKQIENGRYAVQVMSDDIAVAGYFGRFAGSLTVPGVLPDPCEAAVMATIRAAAAFHVQGYDAPASSPITACVPAANHVADTDILVVRRADSNVTATGALVATDVYLQANSDSTNSANPVIALGAAGNFPLLNRDAATVAPVRKYHVHIYFIAPCSIPTGGGTTCTGATDDGGTPIPTLKRMELSVSGGALGMQQVSLVEGIENLQVDYGVDTDADGVPNSYLTVPATVADWANVVALRINVLARNLESSPGYTDAKAYDMGVAGALTPAGAYKRHVYNSVIRVVNPSSKRES